MSKGYPVISVLLAAVFTLSIMLSGCKPDYQNPTETKHTLSSMDPSRETGDSQMPEPSESIQETQNSSEPTEESTEPVASQPTVTPTQGSTQPMQPSTSPTPPPNPIMSQSPSDFAIVDLAQKTNDLFNM